MSHVFSFSNINLLFAIPFILITGCIADQNDSCYSGVKYAEIKNYERALNEWSKLSYDETLKELLKATTNCLELSGIAKNHKEFAQWLKNGADDGVPAAEAQLGLMHLNGLGVEKSDIKGTILLKSAASKGEVSAKVTLAVLIIHGKTNSRNIQEARILLQDAVDLGSVLAKDILLSLELEN